MIEIKPDMQDFARKLFNELLIECPKEMLAAKSFKEVFTLGLNKYALEIQSNNKYLYSYIAASTITCGEIGKCAFEFMAGILYMYLIIQEAERRELETLAEEKQL